MILQMKARASESDHLSSIPEFHVVATPESCTSDLPMCPGRHMHARVCAHTQMDWGCG